MIEFFIPGDPVAKARPKFAVRNGFARAYTPKKSSEYENIVSLYGRKAIQEPLNGPIALDILFCMPIPASTPKKRLQSIVASPHIKRPDTDNLIKQICDGLNGIAWCDDSQVWSISARKIYSLTPGVMVKIIF